MTNCYFCNKELIIYNIDALYVKCYYCSNDEISVSYRYFLKPERYACYVHMSYNDYYIILNLIEKETIISSSLYDSDIIVTLPGFPITPFNVKDKLKMYLLFL